MTKLVKPRENVDPVPALVADCPCANWTYVKEFGKWKEGEHHPNCKSDLKGEDDGEGD